MTPAAVRVSNLVKRYGAHVAVDGVSFEVAPGEVVAILGPNGAGKTTTLEVLEGFRTRDAGDVRVLGLDPAKRSELRQIRALVGIVLQETATFRFLTVRETLEMHRGYHRDPRPLDELLDLVELRESADRQVRFLSGGQARRLDVATALVGRPRLVVLDEPTTGFDPAARRRMWQLVRRLRDTGAAVLLTTHYMEEASELSDRVVVVVDGRVVAEGTPAELASRLRLASTISFTMAGGGEARVLPQVEGALDIEADRVTLRTHAPVEALAVLCSWALDSGVTLDGIEVRPASLEDSYLELTGHDPAGERVAAT